MMDKIIPMGGKIWGYLVIGAFLSACGDSLLSIDNLAPGDAIVFGPRTDRPYHGSFVPLSDQQFQRANALWNSIPTQLFLNDNGVIGSPDAGDWGGIYLEIKVGDSRRFWLIDQMGDNLPKYLIPLRDQINEVISRINQ